MTEKKFRSVVNIFPAIPTNWSVGVFLERFYAGLGEKKITGIKCAKCKKVHLPPRKYCSACGAPMEKFVPIKETGELVNYTVAYQKINGSKRENPMTIGLIKLDGADTAIYGEVRVGAPHTLRTGMKLKAVFADKPGNTVESISHFEPATKK